MEQKEVEQNQKKKKYNRYTKDWKKRNRSRKNRVVKMR